MKNIQVYDPPLGRSGTMKLGMERMNSLAAVKADNLGHAGEHYAMDRARNAVGVFGKLMPPRVAGTRPVTYHKPI